MTIRTELKGASELRKVLRRLPQNAQRRVLQSSLRQGANVIRDEAKALAPVATGKLAASIKVRKVGRSTGDSVHMVVTTGDAFWGNFLEFGTGRQPARPFMRPALDATGGAALVKIGKAMGRGIEREARKLAGSFAKARKAL